MLKLETLKKLTAIGISMVEAAAFTSDEKAEQGIRYIEEGMKKEDVLAYVKAETQNQVTTKKKLGKGEVDPNPENVLTTSASVLNNAVNFGGIKNADFMEWSGMIVLKNQGTSFKSNSLFMPLSKLKDGKIDLVEARAKIEATKRVFEEHLTVLDTVSDYLKTEGDKMGIETSPKVD